MARRGFFARIVDAVRNVFTTTPEPRPTPTPPREPPREGPPRRYDPSDDMRQAWRQETLTRPGRTYRRHAELFNSIPDIDQETPEERDYLWRSYIENMVQGTHRRNDPNNPFWSDIGMAPENFDWDEFRTALGYKSRRK